MVHNIWICVYRNRHLQLACIFRLVVSRSRRLRLRSCHIVAFDYLCPATDFSLFYIFSYVWGMFPPRTVPHRAPIAYSIVHAGLSCLHFSDVEYCLDLKFFSWFFIALGCLLGCGQISGFIFKRYNTLQSDLMSAQSVPVEDSLQKEAGRVICLSGSDIKLRILYSSIFDIISLNLAQSLICLLHVSLRRIAALIKKSLCFVICNSCLIA